MAQNFRQTKKLLEGTLEIKFRKLKINLSFSWGQADVIPPDKLLFDRLHLDGMLRPFFDNKVSLIGILLSQVSVLITIGLTLLVSDISTKWGIDKGIWNFIVIVTFGCLLLWSFIIFVKILKQPSFEKFLSNIISQSLTNEDRRFVFLLIADDASRERKVLVQFSQNWQCWLLPNFPRSQSKSFSTNDDLSKALSQKLGAIPTEFSLLPLNLDLISSKFSYKHGKFTSYYFDFYNVTVTSSALAEKLRKEEFEIGGTKFAWKTTAQLKADPYTRERNSDVIDHLDDRILASGAAALCMTDSVGIA